MHPPTNLTLRSPRSADLLALGVVRALLHEPSGHAGPPGEPPVHPAVAATLGLVRYWTWQQPGELPKGVTALALQATAALYAARGGLGRDGLAAWLGEQAAQETAAGPDAGRAATLEILRLLLGGMYGGHVGSEEVRQAVAAAIEQSPSPYLVIVRLGALAARNLLDAAGGDVDAAAASIDAQAAELMPQRREAG